MLLVSVWIHVFWCVYACFSCSLTWCLLLLEAKACHLLRDKSKNRGELSGDTSYTCVFVSITVCVFVCESCRLVRHETGPDGHPRQSRLGLFTCFTLGHVSFAFSLAATRFRLCCQKTPHLIALLLHLFFFFQFYSVGLHHAFILSIFCKFMQIYKVVNTALIIITIWVISLIHF